MFQHRNHRGDIRRRGREDSESLFEKIMKENFPNLAKEIHFQKSRKLRVPKKLDPRKHTPRHIVITSPKIQEERILKAAREKEFP